MRAPSSPRRWTVTGRQETFAGCALDDPDARPLARVEQGADRHRQAALRSGMCIRDLDGDGGAQWRIGQLAIEHIARLESAGQPVCGIRELPEFGRNGNAFFAEKRGQAG